jgi:hypothetical protein
MCDLSRILVTQTLDQRLGCSSCGASESEAVSCARACCLAGEGCTKQRPHVCLLLCLLLPAVVCAAGTSAW